MAVVVEAAACGQPVVAGSDLLLPGRECGRRSDRSGAVLCERRRPCRGGARERDQRDGDEHADQTHYSPFFQRVDVGKARPGVARLGNITPRNDPARNIRAARRTIRPVNERLEHASEVANTLRANVETVVIGKSEQIGLVLTALTCRGHVLLEDVPGTAKTVLARAVAGSVEGAVASRIQCTPDLQPTDVTGLTVYDQREREFRFRPGPVFANVLLVDEINRALPKTQSALLEAMAEGQVTVDGVTHALPAPFFLLATENPIEQEGTFPLPEAQLDRFFLRTALGYPDLEQELAIVEGQLGGHPLERLRAVTEEAAVAELQAAVEEVYVDPLLRRWIVELVRATRTLEFVELGASVRGSLPSSARLARSP